MNPHVIVPRLLLGHPFLGNADAVVKLEALGRRHGGLTIDVLLAEAQKKDSPLHSYPAFHFDDDAMMAYRARRQVAAGLLRSFRLGAPNGKNAAYFVSIWVDSRRVYVPLLTALHKRTWREQVFRASELRCARASAALDTLRSFMPGAARARAQQSERKRPARAL